MLRLAVISLSALAALSFASGAEAACANGLTTLVNGTTADANAVNQNLSNTWNCANTAVQIGGGVLLGGAVRSSTIDSGNIINTLTNSGVISGGTISGTTLTGTTSNSGTITGGTIGNASINGGVLSGAITNNATVTGGTLAGTVTNSGIISGGTIAGATLSGGAINGASISGGSLTGAITNSATVSGGTLSAPTIDGSTLTGITTNTNAISGGVIYNATITSSWLNTVTFLGDAYLGAHTLYGGTLSGTTFSGATISDGYFGGTNHNVGTINGGTLSQNSIHEAIITNSSLADSIVFTGGSINSAGFQLGVATSGVPTTPGDLTAVSATVANTTGANLFVDAGNGLGTGGSGDIILRTAPPGSSGTTPNTLTDMLHITAGGKVGIGTATPSYLLHVNGQAAGVGAWINLSDSRVKTNVETLTNGLDLVKRLRPVRFDWRDPQSRPVGKDLQLAVGERQLGFVAQEVAAVVPEAVVAPSKDPNSLYGLKEGDLIPVLVAAIKEQQAQIDRLEAEVAAIKASH